MIFVGNMPNPLDAALRKCMREDEQWTPALRSFLEGKLIGRPLPVPGALFESILFQFGAVGTVCIAIGDLGVGARISLRHMEVDDPQALETARAILERCGVVGIYLPEMHDIALPITELDFLDDEERPKVEIDPAVYYAKTQAPDMGEVPKGHPTFGCNPGVIHPAPVPMPKDSYAEMMKQAIAWMEQFGKKLPPMPTQATPTDPNGFPWPEQKANPAPFLFASPPKPLEAGLHIISNDDNTAALLMHGAIVKVRCEISRDAGRLPEVTVYRYA